MSDTDILHRVKQALAADGFIMTLRSASVTFRGNVTVQGQPISTRLEYGDLEFSRPPRVVLEAPEQLSRPVFPHLNEEGELCVVDQARFVSDRYRAAGEARGIVQRTQQVIEAGLTKNATEEIANEFPEHWASALFNVEFGAEYEGPITCVLGPNVAPRMARPTSKKQMTVGASVTTAVRLSFTETQKRPDTLGEFLEWAKAWDASLPVKVMKGLKGLSSKDPYIVITAPNGTVAFQLLVSARGQAQVNALTRPEGWRRSVSGTFGHSLSIRRLRGRRSDLAYALGRNGGGMPPLSDKHVVVVGCGSIGGYLARALAQLGAGFGSGRLILIDDDQLETGNLGRHALGASDVGKAKVSACRASIMADFPGTTILARQSAVQAQKSLVAGADVVLDATGEQGVSEMLNAWMLEAQKDGRTFPALIHVWIEGLGAAVKSYVSSDSEFGCLRCLWPDHSEPDRFGSLRDPTEVALVGGCGEAPYTPYGPSAPMAAASLAAQHAVDWARGNPRPLLRAVRLDLLGTKEVKPTNPSPSAHCPACQRA